MSTLRTLMAMTWLTLCAEAAMAAPFTISFDDLANPPALTDYRTLTDANGGPTINGVTFDERWHVTGRDQRVDDNPGNPLFGLPHSGDYYLSNGQEDADSGMTNDGLTIMTDSVLTELWLGRNEYYGFGGGADRVTITPLGAGSDLSPAVVCDLPEEHDGDPEPLTRFDTSAFAALAGQIKGYRFDRRMIGVENGNYIADSFTFDTVSPAEEPTDGDSDTPPVTPQRCGTGAAPPMLLLLAGLAWLRRQR